MSDKPDDKTLIPIEVQRQQGGAINQSAQQIDPAGRHRIDVNANAEGQFNSKQPGSASAEPDRGADTPGNADAQEKPQPIRDAGPEEMDNPPEEWDRVDEENDESFPASDPPANY